MTKAIAFFPWWGQPHRKTIGPIEIIPYERGKLPGTSLDFTQKDIDDIIGAYSTRTGTKVSKCVLLEVDNWRLGNAPDAIGHRLGQARHALAFASLSGRRLFGGSFDYCNLDSFTLVVQRYSEGQADRFAYSTRRRDGGTSNVWTADQFKFQRPLHVHNYFNGELDEDLVKLLMETVPEAWNEAVIEFNSANTDSPDIPVHIESVMLKSAFELLLGIGQSAAEFGTAVNRVFSDIDQLPTEVSETSVAWLSEWPKSRRLLDAWAREFCAIRGGAAHGRRRGKETTVWSEHSHLAFCALLFPLMFKKVAADAGRFTLSRFDRERIARIDHYLASDPFGFDQDREDEYTPHPWSAVDQEARMADISEAVRVRFIEQEL